MSTACDSQEVDRLRELVSIYDAMGSSDLYSSDDDSPKMQRAPLSNEDRQQEPSTHIQISNLGGDTIAVVERTESVTVKDVRKAVRKSLLESDPMLYWGCKFCLELDDLPENVAPVALADDFEIPPRVEVVKFMAPSRNEQAKVRFLFRREWPYTNKRAINVQRLCGSTWMPQDQSLMEGLPNNLAFPIDHDQTIRPAAFIAPHLEDKEFLKKIQCQYAFEFSPEIVRRNAGAYVYFLAHDLTGVRFCHEKLRDSFYVIKKAVWAIGPSEFLYASERLRGHWSYIVELLVMLRRVEKVNGPLAGGFTAFDLLRYVSDRVKMYCLKLYEMCIEHDACKSENGERCVYPIVRHASQRVRNHFLNKYNCGTKVNGRRLY